MKHIARLKAFQLRVYFYNLARVSHFQTNSNIMSVIWISITLKLNIIGQFEMTICFGSFLEKNADIIKQKICIFTMVRICKYFNVHFKS